MTSWFQFAFLVTLLTMLPGIDTAQMLRASVKGGPRLAYLTLAGIAGGVWVWGIATAVGISAILLASAEIYTVVRWVGAAYLVYLGVRMIVEARKTGDLEISTSGRAESSWRTMSRAFVVTVTNPKNGAFYVAILPQFLPAGMNPIVAGLALATIHNLICLVWFSGVIAVTRAAKKFFARAKVRRVMEYICGSALAAFGIVMAVEQA